MMGCKDSLAILLNLARIMSGRPGTRAQESLLRSLPERVVINFLSAVKHQTQLFYPITCTAIMASMGIYLSKLVTLSDNEDMDD